MTVRYRPLVQSGTARAPGAIPLAGGPLWFTHAEVLTRRGTQGVVPAHEIEPGQRERLSAPRSAIAGLTFDRPRLMGILNVTPDSFSDGGRFLAPEAALSQGAAMAAAGADLIDIGGESTRPGAEEVPVSVETSRTAPVIAALAGKVAVPVSIDTRKAPVAERALDAGAALVNDVSGFGFDPGLAPLCAARGVPVCVMHAQGDPATMQKNPRYDDVLLDVYDFLESRIDWLEDQGIPRARILADPGIGFGKTLDHNLTLLRNLSLFHGLGCSLLVGISRKRFIGTIGEAPRMEDRAPGSIAVGLAALAQGVQILRVHDVAETAQALRLWQAVR